jgi:hypothetical protein
VQRTQPIKEGALTAYAAWAQMVYRILDNAKVSELNKIRVVLLYSLRYV